MTGRVTFTDLVDWVEGRLPTGRAEEVAVLVATDSDAARSADWIRSFVSDAATMRLPRPPAELSARLRAVFDGYQQPSGGQRWRDAVLLHDSRDGAMAGVRSTHVGPEVVQLAYDSDLGRFLLEITRGAAGTVDVHGLVQGASEGVELAFMEDGSLRRAARTDRNGQFLVREVPGRVDELWISRGADSARVRLDLGRT